MSLLASSAAKNPKWVSEYGHGRLRGRVSAAASLGLAAQLCLLLPVGNPGWITRSVDRLMEAECQPLESAVDGARGHEEGELNPSNLLNHAGRKDGIGTNESVLIGTSNARVEETDHDDCFLIMVV